ncbi:MAG: hypothetical protein IJH57_05885 [Mogibacterium sp.]|nr:hypothetical protein [Mogibacterium sp.]
MKSIFRTLIAITFSLLLVMTPSVAVFADDDSALDNNQPAKTQETNKGSDDQQDGTEKSDNNDDDSSPDNNGNIQNLGGDDDNQNLDDEKDFDDNDLEIKPGNEGDDPDFGDDSDLGSDEDGDGEDNGEGTDDDEDIDPAVPAPVFKPVTVSITDFGNSFLFEADADGTVRISGLFITYDYGASGSESFVMIVGGRAYPITIHSTGKVTGRLPKGFSIKNGELIIKGVTADMDIWFVDHSMVSGISEEPDEDGSYYEPSEPSKASEKTIRSSSEQKAAGYTVTATTSLASEEAMVSATEKTAEVIPPANDTAEDEQVLDAFEEPDESKGRTLPLATGIALSVGAVSGLGVLLKLKLFAAL